MDINLQIEKYKNELIHLTSNNGLPIGMTYYVVKDLLNSLKEIYQDTLIQAQQQGQDGGEIENE